jgi:hypothetical protein
MVRVTTAVVAHCAANVSGNCVEIADKRFDGFGFEVRFASDGFVHVVDVSGVMFVVMDFHRLRVDVRFERVF